jgi:urease accessory protein
MSWRGLLTLDYRRDGARTIAHDRHEGPLRVLQRLYPEGDAICHHVLVHPPGGVAGGDTLEMHAHLAEGTHALITTPGATRFYRSAGAAAEQTLHATLAAGARLEWLPLESIAYPGCIAHNRMHMALAPGAEMIGWDMLALGLPAAGQAFDTPSHPHGQFTQSIELPQVWLERGTVKATDRTLLDSPLGWAGQRVLGTLWMASGTDWPNATRDHLLDVAREHVMASPLARQAGATSPHARVVVLRALASRVEPLMQLFTAVRGSWRQQQWQLGAEPPRIWRT